MTDPGPAPPGTAQARPPPPPDAMHPEGFPADAVPLGGTLGLRLALAFLSVALAAVALLAGLTAAFAAADVSNLASQQRAALAKAVAVSAGAAWDRSTAWPGADLASVLDLAATTGTAVQIRDQTGKVVAVSPAFATADGSQSSL